MSRRWSGIVFAAVPLLFPPLAGADGPPKARDFVVWCKDHAGACADRVATAETTLVANRDKRYCAPADDNITPAIPRVLDWLGANASEAERPTDPALTDAWIALYPCGV
jgi:hypothetical protein